jgi:2-oxoglutarate ferredoxin oxidoreductase subunit alpha
VSTALHPSPDADAPAAPRTVAVQDPDAAPADEEPALQATPERVLMKGNEAIAEAAIQAGCDAYFGYPITPQAELLEWMARRMPELGRAFVQAESELAAINMGLGAASTGARVLVSSSSPGMSLMAEAMSYMAGSEVPLVLVNVMRGGPGLGSIGPSQADYFQAVKGHGHGDYRVPVLAPASISEAMALMADAFELAERYRTPVIMLADGILGQAMEPVVPSYRCPDRPPMEWALGGAAGREPRVVKSLHLKPEALEAHNRHLQAKFQSIERREVRWTSDRLDDAELVIVAYGTAARVARTAIDRAREIGLRVGLVRPISLWPFPSAPIAEAASRARGVLVVELSAGQLVEDVRLAVEGRAPVVHHGRTGGMVPSPSEVVAALRHLYAVTAPRMDPHGVTPIAASRAAEPADIPVDADEVDPLDLIVDAGVEAAAWTAEPDPLDLVVDGTWADRAALGDRPVGSRRANQARSPSMAAATEEADDLELDPAVLVTADDWDRFRRRCHERDVLAPLVEPIVPEAVR